MKNQPQKFFDVSPNSGGTEVFTSEVSRISRAYARRTNQSRYSLFDPANLLASHERDERILAAFVRHGYGSLGETRMLEIGCGTGFWLREFVRWGARPENIVGVDLLPERIAEARVLGPPGIDLTCQDAAHLESRSNSFDLVFQSTVFTSILDEGMNIQIAQEMLRVLRPTGMIMWYDFTVNNPWNRDVRGIPRREIKRLFPGCRFEFEKLTLAPPLGRLIAKLSPLLYRTLSAVKVLDTHCLAIIQKTC